MDRHATFGRDEAVESENFLMLGPPGGEHAVLIDGVPACRAADKYRTIPKSLTIVANYK
jgi:hypothetical protein